MHVEGIERRNARGENEHETEESLTDTTLDPPV